MHVSGAFHKAKISLNYFPWHDAVRKYLGGIPAFLFTCLTNGKSCCCSRGAANGAQGNEEAGVPPRCTLGCTKGGRMWLTVEQSDSLSFRASILQSPRVIFIVPVHHMLAGFQVSPALHRANKVDWISNCLHASH